jgi:hypothetical protein
MDVARTALVVTMPTREMRMAAMMEVARPLVASLSLGLVVTATRKPPNWVKWRSRGMTSLLGTALCSGSRNNFLDPCGDLDVINTPGTFQNSLGTFRNVFY